ncbi:MAG: NAD(P)H-hydrate epimerase, partial [Bacteroidetes bacterium]|nr:NAD(P)H-hydrate epimerase [Bacteroidota bacterium]
MKILTTDKIKEADAYTIEYEPIESVDLMERAAMQCSNRISKHFKQHHRFVIFAGPGNNGGDGLAIARQLADKDYEAKVYILGISDQLSPDAEINRQRLKDQGLVDIEIIQSANDFPVFRHDDIILDAMFGSGLKRPLEKMPLELVHYLNSTDNEVIAIDIPSGLFGEDNSKNNPENILIANYTLTFQFPKLSFFFSENEKYVGKWEVLTIGLHSDFIADVSTPYYYLSRKKPVDLRVARKKFAHKGNFGHGLLIAGSYGMFGAAILASKAVIRSGIGLLTTHVPRTGYDIMQISVPEVLVNIDDSDILFTHHPELDKFSAIGVGPGLCTKP